LSPETTPSATRLSPAELRNASLRVAMFSGASLIAAGVMAVGAARVLTPLLVDHGSLLRSAIRVALSIALSFLIGPLVFYVMSAAFRLFFDLRRR
jgi:hypothetical protein